MNATDLLSEVQQRRREIDFKLGQKQTLQDREEALTKDITELQELSVVLDQVTVLLNSIGEISSSRPRNRLRASSPEAFRAYLVRPSAFTLFSR